MIAKTSPFDNLRVALVADELTYGGLRHICKVARVTPFNYKWLFACWRPDILLVESCWNGWLNTWKYGIASYPDRPKKNNHKLRALVEFARDKNIPALFWNKEDGAHFQRFIDSAAFFDHIFTTDENMAPHYRQRRPDAKTIAVLPFVVNSRLHYPKDVPRQKKLSFVGSYRVNLHPGRRDMQDMLFRAALPYGLDIYDRNWRRKERIFRFPAEYAACVRQGVPYEKTGDVYSAYAGCLNVNTVTDSPTMFSRRVVEILACKSALITSRSLSVEKYFSDCALIADSREEAIAHIESALGDSPEIREKIERGAEIVRNHFTYDIWLASLMSAL